MCELTRLLCLCRKAQIVKLAGTILLTAVVLLLSSSELVGHPAWKRERMDVKPGITPEARVILEKAIKAHGGEDAIRRMMKGYEAIENVHFGEHGEYRVVWKWDVNGYVVERVEGAQPTIFYSHDRCLDCYLEVCVPCDDYNSDYVSHYRKNQAYFLLPLLNEPFAVSVPETGDDGAQEHSLSVQYPEMAGNMLLVFDKQTHLLERIEYPEFVQGQVSQAQICLSDYRPVGGMLLPFAGRGKKGDSEYSIEIESISHENIGKDTPFPEEMKSRTSHRLEYGIQSVVSVEYEYDSTGMHPLDPQADEKLASLITIPLGVRQIRVPLLKSIIRLVLGNFHSVFVRVYYPINEGAVEDARKLGLHVKKVGPDSLYCVFYSSLRGDSLSREDIRELLSEYSRQWMQEGRTSNWEVVFLNYDRFFRVRSPGDIVIDVCFNTISYTEVEERYGVKLNK